MCFSGQLGSALDVIVAALWALVNRDPVASQDDGEYQIGEE
jgi:hypothetical protein